LSPHDYSKFIDCGINDWGGISPVTIDYVNPESPWPGIRDVVAITERTGHLLRARLPIYPEYIHDKLGFVNESLRKSIQVLSGADGLVRQDYLN
jgi:FO synthase